MKRLVRDDHGKRPGMDLGPSTRRLSVTAALPTARAGIGALLVLLALDVYARQTRVVVPTQQTSPVLTTGTAAITGHVVDTMTDQPVAAAVVTLEERRPGERRRSYAQVATATGRFAFVDLPASDWYFLTAGKPGYLDGGFRRADPRGPAAPISIGDGQWLRDMQVTLTRPGSISGSVADERGEPVVGAYVRVLPHVLVAGGIQWLAGPVAQTDDRGAYRIAGLGPGRYVVSVPSVQATLPASASIRPPGASAGTSISDLNTAREAARGEKLLIDLGGGRRVVVGRHVIPPPPAPDGRRTAYPITFHPNVTTPADATSIELGLGEARVNVDIHLQPALTARVSGRLIGPADAVGNQLLRLIPIGLEELGQGSEAATTVTLPDGRFDFLDVPAGSYLVEFTHSRLELTHTSVSDASTAVPAPVAFPSNRASSMQVHAAPAGVSLSALSIESADGATHWIRMPVTVAGTDIDNLDVPLRRAVTLSGRIVLAPTSGPPVRFPTLVLEPADGRRSLGMPMSVPVGPRPSEPPVPNMPVEFAVRASPTSVAPSDADTMYGPIRPAGFGSSGTGGLMSAMLRSPWTGRCTTRVPLMKSWNPDHWLERRAVTNGAIRPRDRIAGSAADAAGVSVPVTAVTRPVSPIARRR